MSVAGFIYLMPGFIFIYVIHIVLDLYILCRIYYISDAGFICSLGLNTAILTNFETNGAP